MRRVVVLLLAALAALAVVVALVDILVGPQTGPFALAAVVEPHLLAVGAVAGVAAALASAGLGRPGGWIRLVEVLVVVVAVVRLGAEWWSPSDGTDAGVVPAGETRLGVMSWNLELGSKSTQASVDGILGLPEASRPDVIALQELTGAVAAAIEAEPNIDGIYPYRILEPRDGMAGMGLLSRLPLVVAGYETGPIVLRAGLLLPDGRRVEVLDVHPYPATVTRLAGLPVGLDTRRRDEDLARIRQAVDSLPEPAAALVIGDLNTSPFEAGFATLARGLADAHAEAATGTGFTWRPSSLEALGVGFLRIDVVLSGAWLRPVTAGEDCSIAGDHCRLFATLSVVPAPSTP